MKPQTLLNTLTELRRHGLVSSDREYAALLGKNDQWVRDLRRSGERAIHSVRQPTVMRLRRRLLDWQTAMPRPIAERLGKIIEKIDTEDAMSRWMAHGR